MNPNNPKGGRNRIKNEERRSSLDSKITLTHCQWDKNGLVTKDEYDIKLNVDTTFTAKAIVKAIARELSKISDDSEAIDGGDGDGFDPVG